MIEEQLGGGSGRGYQDRVNLLGEEREGERAVHETGGDAERDKFPDAVQVHLRGVQQREGEGGEERVDFPLAAGDDAEQQAAELEEAEVSEGGGGRMSLA